MDGTATGRDYAPLRWEAQERDGAIVLRIVEDDDDEEEREPLAVLELTRDNAFDIIVALEIAEEKRAHVRRPSATEGAVLPGVSRHPVDDGEQQEAHERGHDSLSEMFDLQHDPEDS